jgi:hypothetical protein
MKQYYEVYENAIITFNGKKTRGNKRILKTKSRREALKLYSASVKTRWVEEITDYGSGESVDIITS